MNRDYNKTTIIIMLSMILPSVFFYLLNFNVFIIMGIMLFLISSISFNLRKSKNIKLSLIGLGFLFSLVSLGLAIYELNFISSKI